MEPQSPAVRVGPTLVIILSLGVAGPVAAQSDASSPTGGGARWALVDGIGFGALGFGLGLAATWDMESDDFGPPGAALAIIGATTVVGTVAGAAIGRRAQKTIASGRPVEGAHRVAVIGGGVAAGGTLGALTAAVLMNPEGEGTVLGSDEQTLTLLVLAGSALGALYVRRHRGDFASRRISLAPEISMTANPATANPATANPTTANPTTANPANPRFANPRYGLRVRIAF